MAGRRRRDGGPQGGPETGFEQFGLILGGKLEGSAGGGGPRPAAVAVDTEAQEELDHLAGNINLRLLNTSDDIIAMLKQVTDEAGDFIAERRGVVLNKQTAAWHTLAMLANGHAGLWRCSALGVRTWVSTAY